MMNTSVHSVVCTTMSATEAEMMIAVLRGAGFHPIDLAVQSCCTSFASAAVFFHIQVPAQELTEARELLDSYEASSSED